MEDLTGKQLSQYRLVSPSAPAVWPPSIKPTNPAQIAMSLSRILPRSYAEDPQFSQRFQREARIIANLEHPHILPIYDFGEQDGYTFLVMRLVEGRSLADMVPLPGHKPLPLPEIVKYISQVADALDYAHQRQVLHRDIKPSNVLVDAMGNCLLSDFGIARILTGNTQLTASGAFLGTPAYASPEQCLGKPDIDHRSDIYSLGVMLYEMATGRLPFSAETPMGVMMMHVHDPLPPPRQVNSDLPEAVERVILKAMSKEPGERYASAGQLASALSEVVEAPPALAPKPAEETIVETVPVQLPPTLPNVTRPGLPWSLVIALAVFLVVLGLAWVIYRLQPSVPGPTATITLSSLAGEVTASPTQDNLSQATSTSASVNNLPRRPLPILAQ